MAAFVRQLVRRRALAIDHGAVQLETAAKVMRHRASAFGGPEPIKKSRCGKTSGDTPMSKLKILALAAFASALAASAPAKAFCLLNCEPGPEQAGKVFESVIHQKFDPDAKVIDFKVDRFWRLDVEGAGHKGVEFYFTAKVEFPKGAHLECKPTEAADGSKTVPAGCSASTYYSTTRQIQEVKEKQYIEPGKVIDFKDETRLDETSEGWKGQDGKIY
jgi:hypothetical protein